MPRASPLVLVVLACALLAGCGDRSARSPVPSTGFRAHGLAMRLPAGWQPARVRLTPTLIDPREVLSVATFPLRYRRTRCAHVAGSALTDLGPRDAFVTVQERGLHPGSIVDFPARPARFGPRLGGVSEAAACVPAARFSDHWFGFTDGGRHFYVEVAFGPRTPGAVREQAWAILDSLRVDPHVRPTWRASS